MLEHTRKQRFRYRKGQWRKRTIALITQMTTLCEWGSVHGVDSQLALEQAAKLSLFGSQGETHLRDAEELDFHPHVLHDIRMMLLVIASFGAAFRLGIRDAALIAYMPSVELEIWDQDDNYSQWTTHTRKQFHAFMDLIKEMQ